MDDDLAGGVASEAVVRTLRSAARIRDLPRYLAKVARNRARTVRQSLLRRVPSVGGLDPATDDAFPDWRGSAQFDPPRCQQLRRWLTCPHPEDLELLLPRGSIIHPPGRARLIVRGKAIEVDVVNKTPGGPGLIPRDSADKQWLDPIPPGTRVDLHFRNPGETIACVVTRLGYVSVGDADDTRHVEEGLGIQAVG